MARRSSQKPASVQHYLVFLFLVCVASLVSLVIYFKSEHHLRHEHLETQLPQENIKQLFAQNSLFIQKLKKAAALKGNNESHQLSGSNSLKKIGVDLHQHDGHLLKRINKVQSKERGIKPNLSSENMPGLNFNVHLFYYPWYGNPKTDGEYVHWSHAQLPHWKKEEIQKWPLGKHVPPDDIGANFYPALGPYSSSDPVVIDKHMLQVRSTGAGVIVVSWYPPGEADDNGRPDQSDQLIPFLLDSAQKHGVKVALHIEPYKNRSGQSLSQHVQYVINTYGQHPAFYRREVGRKHLPVFYIYDSYQINPTSWAQALTAQGKYSLRGTKYDAIFLGLYVSNEDEQRLIKAGFDGFYTYFATNGFTKGSSWKNWKSIADFAMKNNLLFVPSVGPGYVDTRIRPWNGQAMRNRLQGKYFREAFQAAFSAKVKLISVTSFNEWHEGTQVEPAVPKTFSGFRYEDYSPGGPDFYLQLLKEQVDKFSQLQV